MPDLTFHENEFTTAFFPLAGFEHSSEECDSEVCTGCSNEISLVTAATGGLFVRVYFSRPDPGGITARTLMFIAQLQDRDELAEVASDMNDAFDQCIAQYGERISRFCT